MNGCLGEQSAKPYLHAQMIAIIVSFLVGLAGVVLAGVGCYALLFGNRRSKRLPPFSSASMMDNIKSSGVQKSVYQLERNRKFFAAIPKDSFGGSPYGSVYQIHIPFLNPFIMVSDYQLGKLVLTGDSKAGVKEGEKSHIMKAMNFLDRSENSLLTHLTADEGRERARKEIAQSFSTTNLNRTWPHVKGVIAEQFAAFHTLSKSREVIDVKNAITLFFMRTLSRGAFGIEFTDDGTETEDNINGLAYLKAGDIAARESAREIISPFRPYMFWEQGVKDNKLAVKELRRSAEKVLRLHAAKKAKISESTSAESKAFSVLDHIAQHAYGKEITKLSDVSIFTFAGIDTTAYTFCFMLMEMCRNPAVKAKLQAELATFMPPLRAAGTSTTDGVQQQQMSEKELLSAIAGCEYLNWCIKEILRLWPVAGGGPGRDLVEDIEYNGMLLPKGSLVIAHVYSMFRERWIDQPDAYLPERWSDSNPQLPQLKEMLMPFSLGKRACIGQNMAMFQLRIVAAHFLHYFDFELAAEPTFEYFLTLKPDLLMMRVHERI